MNKMKSVGPDKNSQYEQDFFVPKNPEKYKSLIKKIIYRSSLERKFCEFCDKTPKVIGWVSEPFSIPYIHPFEKDINDRPKVCNYYVDYYMEYIEGNPLDEQQALQAGMDMVLHKPINPKALVRTVSQALAPSTHRGPA